MTSREVVILSIIMVSFLPVFRVLNGTLSNNNTDQVSTNMKKVFNMKKRLINKEEKRK